MSTVFADKFTMIQGLRGLALVLGASMILGGVRLASAHEDHGDSRLAAFEKGSRLHALHEHLEEARHKRLTGTVLKLEEKKLGAELAAAVVEEWDVFFAADAAKPWQHAMKRVLQDKVLARLNVAKLGKWLLQVASTHGPALAIAYAASETLESSCLVLAAMHPKWVPILVPLGMSHVGDAIVFGVGLKGPEAVRTMKLWSRHGGILQGSQNYFRFLVNQRKALPLDMERIVNLVERPHADGGAALRAAVMTDESWPEGDAPWARGVRELMNPQSEAQRRTSPHLSLGDLEKIAKQHKLPLKRLKPFRSDKDVYLGLLLHRLGEHRAANADLLKLMAARNEGFGDFWSKADDFRGVPLEDVLRGKLSAADLMKSGESPDVLARRMLPLVRERYAELLSEVESHYNWAPAEIRGALKQLRGSLDQDKGLWRTANTAFTSAQESDYETLLKDVKEAKLSLDSLDAHFAQAHVQTSGATHAHSHDHRDHDYDHDHGHDAHAHTSAPGPRVSLLDHCKNFWASLTRRR